MYSCFVGKLATFINHVFHFLNYFFMAVWSNLIGSSHHRRYRQQVDYFLQTVLRQGRVPFFSQFEELPAFLLQFDLCNRKLLLLELYQCHCWGNISGIIIYVIKKSDCGLRQVHNIVNSRNNQHFQVVEMEFMGASFCSTPFKYHIAIRILHLYRYSSHRLGCNELLYHKSPRRGGRDVCSPFFGIDEVDSCAKWRFALWFAGHWWWVPFLNWNPTADRFLAFSGPWSDLWKRNSRL